MLRLKLDDGGTSGRRTVLAVGAHSDDIEIGCGGTLLELAKAYPDLSVYWIVFSARPERRAEALASADDFLVDVSHKQIEVYPFRDGYFPHEGAEIKDVFEALKQQVSPDLIFTHCRHDLHQDHRVLCELAWNTFRNHMVLEYEIPKYDGDLGAPNAYVSIDTPACERKVDLLMRHFGSQRDKHWFTPETFRAIMRIRGVESRSPSGYAEAFYARKFVLG